VHRNRFVVPAVLVLAAAYGAGTQYVGARLGGAGHDIAQLSAPWLVIAFLAGSTQRTPGRAALLGFAATYATLVGYWLMTDSSIEGAHYTLALAQGFLVSNASVVVGGLVTGPLFGWFGHRWRTRGALVGAVVTAAALCLEPLARQIPARFELALTGGWFNARPTASHAVVLAEVAVGLVLVAAVLVQHRASRA
jgi:hypothetical protein